MIEAAETLASFNESGEIVPFPEGFDQGNANPKDAKDAAALEESYLDDLP